MSGISRRKLQKLLQRLPDIEHAKGFLRASRLYSEALSLIRARCDLAYLLLVYCVETIAVGVNEDYVPSRSKKNEVKGSLRKALQRHALPQADVDSIIDAECKSISWTKDKCKKFLTEHAAVEDFAAEDDLFPGERLPCEEPEDFNKALDQVFDLRNRFVHAGQPYPVSTTLGLTPRVNTRIVTEILAGEPLLPAVVWFERVINSSMNNYLSGQVFGGASNAE